MQDALTGGWTGVRESHVSAEVASSLRELNHRFLELVAARPDRCNGSRRVGLPDELSGQFAPLSAAQRAAVADCPYALFDLRFHDQEHWRLRLSDPAPWHVSDAAAGDRDVTDFALLALFFAWHVSATAGLTAQLLLGMTESTAAAFRKISLNLLPALVASETIHLTARWNDRRTYWDSLACAAARPDAKALRRVQLYGFQLAAAARLEGHSGCLSGLARFSLRG